MATYGGGSGISQYHYDFNYDGDYVDVVSYGPTEETKVSTNETDMSTSSGSVTRFTEVNILGGIIHRNVYGGGSLGSVGAPKIDQDYRPYRMGDTADGHGVGKQSMNIVNIGGSRNTVVIGTHDEYASHYGGEVFGACRGVSTLNADDYATCIWTQVNIKDNVNIQGNVFGGGDAGKVWKSTEVIIGDKKVTP